MDFNKFLQWRLLSGSHEFPGPDGGTCINEAAIVAAGFKYKAVRSAADCPPCFSPVISAYAIGLNDKMPDDLRQRLLMPFVTRLAETADTFEIEKKRLALIVERTKREIGQSVRVCAFVTNAADVYDAAAAYDAAYAAYAAAAAYADVYAAAADAYAADVYAAAAADVYAAAYAAHFAIAANAANAAIAAKERIWTIAVSILDEAIRLGKQAEPIETAVVVERMERAKALA